MSVPSYIKLTPNMSQDTLVNALNNNFNTIQGKDRRNVITDENGNSVILLGRELDGSYAIKMAAPGYDVNTATPDQLILSSDWDMWKIINSGSIVRTVDTVTRSGTLSLTSTHIAYVHDLFIKVDDIWGNLSGIDTVGYAGHLQCFVRNIGDRGDITFYIQYLDDGTNKATMYRRYRIIEGGWIAIRTVIHRTAGTVGITPRNEIAPYYYWAIANPTRTQLDSGGGGGGTPTAYFYHDSVIDNVSSSPLYCIDDGGTKRVLLAAKTLGRVKSSTMPLYGATESNQFERFLDTSILPPWGIVSGILLS